MNKITFIPVGGLANRMRAIASALDLSAKTQSQLDVVWIKDWALNAPFYELFEPVDSDIMTIRDASLLDRILLDRPRRKNLHYTCLTQKLLFRSSLYERSITPLCREGFDFCSWVKENKNVYFASYTNFMDYDSSVIKKLFVPVDDVRKNIENFCAAFESNTIGLHIRRTDNVDSIKQSPIELFYDKIDKEIAEDDNVKFFLATDSEEVKKEMKERYGQRILFSQAPADRDSVQGIKGGVAEMFILSRTTKIYGSFQSSFSQMAAQISGIPLEILKL